MKRKVTLYGVVLLYLTYSSHFTNAQDIRFPDDARIVKVTDFGAVPDDGQDDTKAIQDAISFAFEDDGTIGRGRYGSPPFVYFPKGVYNISDKLEGRVADHTGWSAGWRSGMLLFGESRTGTILKLDDNASGFTDQETPKAVIYSGSESDGNTNEAGGGNRAFRNSVMNMTIDIGSGNPGAVGIDYVANNRGTVKWVTIKSSDPNGAGFCGLRLERWWPGPALVRDVHIEGFDYAIRLSHYQYSMTFEHISIAHQNIAGIRNMQNTVIIRDLTSDNGVPVIDNGNTEHGHFDIIDGEFKNGGTNNTAIRNQGKLFLRNVIISGYGKAVDDITSANKDVEMTGSAITIGEYFTNVYALFPSPEKSLNLPVKESPDYHTNDFNKWANAEDHGATAGDGSNDDADGIQKAIDSGAEIVYLPNGSYSISKPIIVRGNVRKIMGMQSGISSKSDFQGTCIFRFDGGTSDNVIIEHIRAGQPGDKTNFTATILHNSGKGLAVRHCDTGDPAYENTANGTGDMFWDDNIGRQIIVRHPQNFWARQLNAEFGNDPLVENYGGTMWLLGMKTEGQMTNIKNVGGTIELIGALWYPLNTVDPNTPMLINDEGRVSMSWTRNGSPDYPIKVRERRNGEWRELTNASSRVALYVGYEEAVCSRLQEPYPAQTHTIPGKIEAEDYDDGCPEEAFYDLTEGNAQGDYRKDDVDIWQRSDGGYHVGYTEDGEWLEYTTDVTAGTYDITLRVASIYADKQIKLLLGNQELGTITVPNTGNWETFTDVIIEEQTLSAGKQTLRAEMIGGEINFDWVEFQPSVTTSLTTKTGYAVHVYPNPANKNLFITSDRTLVRIVMTDITGRKLDVKIKKAGNRLYEITLPDLAGGIYLLQVQPEDNNEIYKKVLIGK